MIFEAGMVPGLNDLILFTENLKHECFEVNARITEEGGNIVARYTKEQLEIFINSLFGIELKADGKTALQAIQPFLTVDPPFTNINIFSN